jgi:hypothetical protein
VDLRPDGVPTRGYSGPGRIPLRHSNKWYQSRRSEKPEKTSVNFDRYSVRLVSPTFRVCKAFTEFSVRLVSPTFRVCKAFTEFPDKQEESASCCGNI